MQPRFLSALIIKFILRDSGFYGLLLKRNQECVSENKRLKTASFDANSGWGTVSLFIVEEVMLYLDLPDILESARVCSHWYNVVQGQLLSVVS